jgi:hypothetical protein
MWMRMIIKWDENDVDGYEWIVSDISVNFWKVDKWGVV